MRVNDADIMDQIPLLRLASRNAPDKSLPYRGIIYLFRNHELFALTLLTVRRLG